MIEQNVKMPLWITIHHGTLLVVFLHLGLAFCSIFTNVKLLKILLGTKLAWNSDIKKNLML
jgi:hypothetical protein